MAKNRKRVLAKPVGKLPRPGKYCNGQQLVAITQQQVATIEACPDYPNHPAVQYAAAQLGVNKDVLAKTVADIAALRADLISLEAARDAQIVTVLRDRRNVETAITAASKGDVEALKAWGCVVVTRNAPAPSTDPPDALTVLPSRGTPGTVVARCPAVPGATSYLFQISSGTDAELAAAPLIISAQAKHEIAGQPLGQTIAVRAAVVRRSTGQSRWTEAVRAVVR